MLFIKLAVTFCLGLSFLAGNVHGCDTTLEGFTWTFQVLPRAQGLYSRQKYYCYHHNAKLLLLLFRNGNFSNIAPDLAIALPTLR